MRVLLAPPGAPPDPVRVASEMLNLEHGCRAYAPDLSPLSEPRAPWPTIEIPPETDAGLPVTVAYRPSVGYVYHTFPPQRVIAFVVALRRLLSGDRAAHLAGWRAAAATATGVARSARRPAVQDSVVRGWPAWPGGSAETPQCLRRFVVLDEPPEIAPSSSSVGARFTWVVVHARAIVATPVRSNLDFVNSVVASLYCPHGRADEPLDDDTDRLHTPPEAFDLPLPAGLVSLARARPEASRAREWLAVGAGGDLTLVGASWTPFGGAGVPLPPRAAWDSGALSLADMLPEAADRYTLRAGTLHVCVMCGAPAGGELVAIRAAGPAGCACAGEISAILAGRAALMCIPCWRSGPRPDPRFTSAALVRAPFSQADECARVREFQHFAPLLRGRARVVEGRRAAIVEVTGGRGERSSVIVTSFGASQVPLFEIPQLPPVGMPVFRGARLAA